MAKRRLPIEERLGYVNSSKQSVTCSVERHEGGSQEIHFNTCW